MKIAFFVDHFPSVTQTFILNQITGMLDRGHEVVIFTERLATDVKVHEEVQSYRLLERTTSIGCLTGEMPGNKFFRLLKAVGHICRYVWCQPQPILKSLNVFQHGKRAASLYLLFQIVAILKRGRFDVLHCQFGTLGLKALALRKFGVFSGKLVVSFRGFDVTQYLKARPGVYNDLFRVGDLFLPVSNVLNKKLIDNGCPEQKILVHHSGIDCTKFDFQNRLLQEGEPVRVLTVGRLTEKKGISYVIEAIAKILSAGRAVTYTVVGEGELRGELENLINRLGVEKSVQLVGWKNHEEVAEYMKRSHILAAPSVVAADGDEEGIPNVVKEAMAVGLPVVSTLHGGIPELVDDGVSGFLVPERNVDALAERLTYLIDHPARWPEMGGAGRAKVLDSFDIEKLNNSLEQRYDQLLE